MVPNVGRYVYTKYRFIANLNNIVAVIYLMRSR